MDPTPGVPAVTAPSERLVARLWEEQRPLRLPLSTTDGELIEVVYRGRRRWDRGPDFAGALIAWPGARLSWGEVEVHVRSSDWWAHGHHRDPRYQEVMLQVVLWDDSPSPARRVDGTPVPVVALAPFLAIPLEELLLSPEPEAPVPIPCWPGSPEDGGLVTLLEGCGRDRLAGKAAQFEADLTCSSPDQLLYRGIAEALGYSRNSLAFRRLADLEPLELLLACREDAEAVLMGAAGLLPSQRGLPVDGDPHVDLLEARWMRGEERSMVGGMSALEWEFFRVRPTNFPTRRLAALACVVAQWPEEGLAAQLEGMALSLDPGLLPRRLEGILLSRGDLSYWRSRCDFGVGLGRPVDLVGRQRAAEVAVNVFLPFLVAWAAHRGDPRLGRRVWEAYGLYPRRGDNELTRYMATHIMGAPRPRVARSASRQQGLLHLYWRWCERKRCAECPVRSWPFSPRQDGRPNRAETSRKAH